MRWTAGEWMRTDLRLTLRSLRKRPAFTAVAVAALALGIGANSAMFSIVNAVVLRPLPYAHPDRLVVLEWLDAKGAPARFSPSDVETWRSRTSAFEKVAVRNWRNLTISGIPEPVNVYAQRVSRDGFAALGARAAMGRTLLPRDYEPGAPDVVVLSYGLWTRSFARDPNVIGRQVLVNGRSCVVAGVMPPDFYIAHHVFQAFIPWQPVITSDRDADRGGSDAFGLLKPSATLQQAQAEADVIAHALSRDDPKIYRDWRVKLTPLTESLLSRSMSRQMMVLLAAVGFVLLIACLNVANLTLARSSERRREMAVRTALGAGRLHVMGQVLAESFLLAGAGAALGLWIAAIAVRAVLRLLPAFSSIPRIEDARLDGTVLLFTLAIAGITALLSGLAPALKAARIDVHAALKDAGRTGEGSAVAARMVRPLIVVETALSLILLIGAALMLRSLSRMLDVDMGFQPQHVLTVAVPQPYREEAFRERQDALQARYRELLRRTERVPGVRSAALITALPLGNFSMSTSFAAQGLEVVRGQERISTRSVSAGFFRTMGIAVPRGREFNQSDTAQSAPVAIVNQALAKLYWPNEDPVGKLVTDSPGSPKGPWITVVGVAANIKQYGLTEKTEPEYYRPADQLLGALNGADIVLRTAEDPLKIAASVRAAIREAYPDQPVGAMESMEQVIGDSVSQPRFYTVLLAGFAGLALLLAGAGVYGVMSYSVSLRTYEFGVRMALGADASGLLVLVLRRAMLLTVVGLLIGVAGAAALSRLLASELYEIAPTDPATFAVAAVVILFAAAAAAFLPALRASRVDPMVALRNE